MQHATNLSEFSTLPHPVPVVDVSACLEGCPQAWRSFIEEYEPIILRAVKKTLTRYGGSVLSPADSGDVVQEVYVRLVRSSYRLLSTWDPQRGTLPTWLAVVARSTAIDCIRDKKYDYSGQEIDDTLSVSEQFLDEGLPEFLDSILSKRQRYIIHLLFEKDMDSTEIAKFLEIHPQTVRSIHHMAIQKIKSYCNRLPGVSLCFS